MSQNISFLGKVYNKKLEGSGEKARLSFTLSVRKSYVSEEDKKAGKINLFIPMVIFGKRAEALEQYFPDGRPIYVSNCTYETWQYKSEGDVKYGHNFKVGDWSFVPEDSQEEKSTKKSESRKSRFEDEYDDEDEQPKQKRSPQKEELQPVSNRKPSRRFEDDDEESPF